MTKLFSLTLATAALAFALITGPAMAEETAPKPPHQMGACHEDVQKFCKDVKPGHGAIAECIKAHEAELSAPCKEEHEKMTAMREKMRAEHKSMMEACKADEEKFCKDVKPGHGAIGKCMKEHEAELSEACKDAHAKMPKPGMMMHKGAMMHKGMMQPPATGEAPAAPTPEGEAPKAE